MKFEQLNESFNKLYGISEAFDDECDCQCEDEYNDGFDESCQVEEYCDEGCCGDNCEDELEEGILDKIKSKVHSMAADSAERQLQKYQRNARATEDPADMIRANRANRKSIERQHQSEISDAKANARGIEDEVRRKAQVYRDTAQEKQQADKEYKDNVKTFITKAKQEMANIQDKSELDELYYEYLAHMRKATKGRLKYSDPMYQQLTKVYQQKRKTL